MLTTEYSSVRHRKLSNLAEETVKSQVYNQSFTKVQAIGALASKSVGKNTASEFV
ncbi:hypothetical protein C0J52_15578 [Blattella germanica]|nr:hypothetical protein C0J52_15578 [Blattella germanica]